MFSGYLLHYVFGIMGPMYVCFDCTQNTDVIVANICTGVVPVGPGLICIDATGILKGEA